MESAQPENSRNSFWFLNELGSVVVNKVEKERG
jgi:hypothetical protein